jgi:hypothetical protein
MKLKLYNIFIGLILGLMGGYLYTYLYPNTIIEEKVEYRYKYAIKTVYLDKPKIRSFILPEDTLYIPADTAELIARYKEIWTKHNTRNFYQDTFKLDTFGYFVANLQVIRNEVDSLSGRYELKIPEKITTKFVYPKNSLYIGGLMGQGNISPMVMYTNKGKYNYLVSYNLVRSEVNAGVLIKFK